MPLLPVLHSGQAARKPVPLPWHFVFLLLGTIKCLPENSACLLALALHPAKHVLLWHRQTEVLTTSARKCLASWSHGARLLGLCSVLVSGSFGSAEQGSCKHTSRSSPAREVGQEAVPWSLGFVCHDHNGLLPPHALCIPTSPHRWGWQPRRPRSSFTPSRRGCSASSQPPFALHGPDGHGRAEVGH